MEIDYDRDSRLTEFAKDLLKDYYMLEGESSPQDAFARAAKVYSYTPELAQRIYDYVSQGWFMYASPVLSNAPREGEKARGLPISCFLSYVGDSRTGLSEHYTEVTWLSSNGGGVGGHWGDVRSDGTATSAGSQSTGIVPFLHVADSLVLAVAQGKTRRGSYAAYVDVSHPEIKEFIGVRVPGGDPNRKCLNMHNAVNVTDDFLEAVYKGYAFNLVDPHTKRVVEQVDARELWQSILECRFRTGEPYINYIDEANRQLPQSLKDKGLTIKGSNLCNEIHLPTNEERTAVCCLSSLNLEKYDEWKDSTIVEDLVEFLDGVLGYFIHNAPPELDRAIRSATRERSIGLGAMGFHSYLQSKGVAFESPVAKSMNMRIFKDIHDKAHKASQELGARLGSYPDLTDGVKRNAHLIAIAPNANSGIMLGTSPSIEPLKANVYTQKTRAGTRLIRNKYLDKFFKESWEQHGTGDKEHWVEQQWQEVLNANGSVQGLTWMEEYDKLVFKTAVEIDQRWVVDHARDRQKYICQGQSVNLFFPHGADKGYVHNVHLRAFMLQGTGVPLKGLYYLRTNAPTSTEQVGLRVEREALKDYDECLACEG